MWGAVAPHDPLSLASCEGILRATRTSDTSCRAIRAVDWTAKRNAMRDMRILHIINSLDRGGAESNLARLCSATALCGVTNVVVTLKSGGVLRDRVARDAKVVSMSNVVEALKLIRGRTESFDAVVGWMYLGCVVASGVTPSSVPVIWSIRHVPNAMAHESRSTRFSIGRLRGYCQPPSRRRPRLIITNSLAARDSHEALGLQGDYRVICNGVDVERFSPNRAVGLAFRRELGIGDAEIMMLQVGRYHRHKGQELLLDGTIDLLRRRHDLQLVLIGGGVKSIRHPLFADETLARRVHRLSDRDDLVPAYCAADLLISPSLTESFPTVVIEAMSCAVPCVVSDVGAAREIVGDTGEGVAAASVGALSAGIERLIERSPNERRGLGAAARQRVLDRYAEQRMSAAFVDAYQSVARQARS